MMVVPSRSNLSLPAATVYFATFTLTLHPTLAWTPVLHPARARPSLLRTKAGPFEILSDIEVVDPLNGSTCRAVDDQLLGKTLFGLGGSDDAKALVVICEQLGDFDSAEYTEQLVAVLPDLEKANIKVRIIGIGDSNTARLFSSFTGLPLENIRMDPTAKVHEALECHRGPNWDVPSFIPDGLLRWFANEVGVSTTETDEARGVTRAWLNYMAMCAGIAAPGTLAEIFRGYIGDRSAPERLRADETVTAGPVAVTGITDVKVGPIEYQSLWKSEKGYQRPAELATVRLRSMVEVLSNFGQYVPDQRYLDWRGATFIFDSRGNVEYEYRNRGVLTYSETMPRPLTFLASYIGEGKATNPLGLADDSAAA